MESIWKKSAEMPSFPALEGDLSVDVLVIGGGLAGLLCARRLSEAGINYALIERERICSRVTANTTAKLTSQHGLIYSSLLKQFGPERAKMYWQSQQEAVDAFRTLSDKVPCSFERKPHYVYATQSLRKLEQEKKALQDLGIPFTEPKQIALPLPSEGAIEFADQAQFHPLEFAAGIGADLNIYEHTPAREFVEKTVLTDRGQIRAEKIIVATHFPILNKHGAYFLKLYQQRSYVLAVENAMDVEGMYLAAEKEGFSFRNFGSALLIGSGSHRTGKKSAGWKDLEAFVQNRFPEGRITARWANQDCMTLDGLPYIGQYSSATPDLYIATGFNKWGMTNAMAASMILTDLVQGRENPYAALFSPQRSMLHTQLAWNALESSKNLLTPTRPRCPHLGCALKWNPQEHSWDCPCHGSRFSEGGKLLNDPATDDLPDK